MDWNKVINLGNKAKDILAMAKESFDKSGEYASDESVDVQKSLFGKKEKEELERQAALMEEQKKKQETTLMYIIGALLVLIFTGIIKIGK